MDGPRNDLSESTLETLRTEFSTCLKDRVFADYFNVFCSLPVFAQHVLYKFDDKDFEFDPPLKKKSQVMDRKKLIDWLISVRLPLFYKSEVYRDYVFCRELLDTDVNLKASSHDIDYDDVDRAADRSVICEYIGHMIGMNKFRRYLEGTKGELSLEFCKDVDQYRNIRTKDTNGKKELFRMMQIKYFQPGGIISIPNPGMWGILADNSKILEEELTAAFRWTSNDTLDKQPAAPPTSLDEMAVVMKKILKCYWLPKFILHCCSKSAKEDMTDKLKVKSISDLRIMQQLKDFDKTLRLIQGNLKPVKSTQKNKSKVLWNALFPDMENQVSEAFLQCSDDLVTLHPDGCVVLQPMNSSKIDAELEQYEHVIHNMSSGSSLSDAQSIDSLTQEVNLSEEFLRPLIRIESSGSDLRIETDIRPESKLLGAIRRASDARKKRNSGEPVTKSAKCRKGSHSQSPPPPRPYSNLAVRCPSPQVTSWLRDSSHSVVPSKHTISRHSSRYTPSPELLQQTFMVSSPTPSPDLNEMYAQHLVSPTHVNTWSSKCFLKVDSSSHKRVGYRSGKRNSDATELFPSIFQMVPREDGNCPIDGVCRKSTPKPKVDYIILPTINEGQSLVEQGVHHRKTFHLEELTVHGNDEHKNFYKNHQMIFAALASENLAGKPLRRFLKEQKVPDTGLALTFWNDCLVLLADIDTAASSYDVQEHLRFRKAHIFVLKHLLPYSNLRVCIGDDITESLIEQLPKGQGLDLIREAHNIVTQAISSCWQVFLQTDKDTFDSMVMCKRPRKRNGVFSAKKRFRQWYKNSVLLTSKVIGNEDGETEGKLGCQTDYIGLSQRRIFRALQLSAYMKKVDLSSFHLDLLPVDELDFEPETQHGSLSLRKLEIVKRSELEAERERVIRMELAVRAAELARQRAAVHNLSKEESDGIIDDDDTPPFARSFRKEGRLITRPQKPRSFAELMRSSSHVEFFKRFLAYHSADVPINFWLAVEELKACKDPRQRQITVNQILRRYFLSPRRYAELDTTAEVIREIPKMDKVTPAMLVSAQSCTVRSLEQRWFNIYMATFEERIVRDVTTRKTASTPTKEPHVARWGREKTKDLWRQFVKSVMRFREGILNAELSKMFGDYLNIEKKREIDKQTANGNTNIGHGVPVRKVIKNKLVDMNRLVADLHFLAEGERYRTLCDNATEAAANGTYQAGDQRLLESKAKTIITCFLESEVPPRMQINISHETYENILENFNRGLVDRSLFHDACMAIFPIMCYLWKRFQKYRFAMMFMDFTRKKQIDAAQREREAGDAGTPALNNGKLNQIARSKTPDFLNIDMSKVKQVTAEHNDEDTTKVNFSLSHGIRIAKFIQKDRDPEAEAMARYSMFYKGRESRMSLRRYGSTMSQFGSKMKIAERFNPDGSRRRSSIIARRRSIVGSNVSLAGGSRAGESTISIQASNISNNDRRRSDADGSSSSKDAGLHNRRRSSLLPEMEYLGSKVKEASQAEGNPWGRRVSHVGPDLLAAQAQMFAKMRTPDESVREKTPLSDK